jgi:hypothetical protein
MELNGCGAEPAHVYQPGYPLLKALKVFFVHWQNMFTISMQNKNRGVSFTSVTEGVKHYKKFNATVK